MLRAASFVAACGLAAFAGAHAQTTATPVRDPRASFRGGVELVQLDVSVLDRDGLPVRGLTAADFSVVEDGVARPIAAFTDIDVPDRISTGAAWLREVATDVASNRADAQRVVVILFDDVHTPFDPGVTRTAKEIASAVVDRLGPADLSTINAPPVLIYNRPGPAHANHPKPNHL